MKNTFETIVGGTEADVYAKFPWLQSASFSGAQIDIRGFALVWKDGTWEGGIWEGGIWKSGIWEGGLWQGGTWENGLWKGGVWEGGTWVKGLMWSNIHQRFFRVQHDGEKFYKVEE